MKILLLHWFFASGQCLPALALGQEGDARRYFHFVDSNHF